MAQMRVLLSALFLVGMAHAASPCCTPDQWECAQTAIEQRVNGGAVALITSTRALSYDITNQRRAVFINVTSGSGKSNRRFILQDYKQGIEYTLDLETRDCTQLTVNPVNLFDCYPDSSRVSNIVYGDNDLRAQSYSYDMLGFKCSTSVNHQCYPIVQIIEGEGMLQTIEYFNISPGIKNPGVFNVPTECLPSTWGIQDLMHTLLGH